MRDILKKIEKHIAEIEIQQAELGQLTTNVEKLREELSQLQEEQRTIPDKNSGFYQDMSEQISKKYSEFLKVNHKRVKKDRELDTLFIEKKTQIKDEIADIKRYVDENRNVNIDELQDILVGKTPREKFIEMCSLEEMIDKNFNRKDLDIITEHIDKEREEQINDMASGRKQEEQREQEEQELSQLHVSQLSQRIDPRKEDIRQRVKVDNKHNIIERNAQKIVSEKESLSGEVLNRDGNVIAGESK